jgi:hypothetical protein
MTFFADILPASIAAALPSASTVAQAAAITSAGLGVAGAQQAAASQRMQARVQQGQAQQAQFAAQQETLRGFQQSLALREQLSRVLAAQNARYAAAGLTLDGTPETVADATRTVAERELALNDANTTIRSEQIRTQSNLLSSQADATGRGADFTSWAGTIGAGVNLFDSLDRQAARRAGQTVNINLRQQP